MMAQSSLLTQAQPARAGASAAAEARNPSIPARIAEQIRELIVRGALSPGVHLGQMQLAERFGASRVPVREALKLLAAEGLLLHDPNRGFFVAALSSDEARQLYRMRHIIEVELLSSVQWPSPAQIAELNVQLDDLDELLNEGDRAQWAIRHRDFHRAIFDLSPQKVLVREVLRLWTLTDRYRSLLPAPHATVGESGVKDERALLDALAKKDRQRLLREFERDRSHIESMLLGLLGARDL
jgi:DNA-binding GntR family transcriptional regulator